MPADLVIRGGTVIDGSGLAGYTADIAIAGGRIAEIGRVSARGAREIDADGMIVTPGFIDGHTHMDAQLNWDPLGTSSCWHGVTTAVMGNCGFTIAPVKRGGEALVVRNLERAEDISATAMAQGIEWKWERFAEYLDAVDALPKGINYACYIGHSALRTWAMGDRAFSQAADCDDLALMRQELTSALRAGAIGFSTSRSFHHETSDGRPVASRLANWQEVRTLVNLVGQHDGVFELAQERASDPDERRDFLTRLSDLAVESGARVTFGVLPSGPRAAWHDQIEVLHETAARGGRMIGQSHSRGTSALFSFETSLPFDRLAEWKPVRSRPLDEQLLLLRDPEVKRRLVHAAHHGDYGRAIGAEVGEVDWNRVRVYQSPLPPNPKVIDEAAKAGKDPVEYMIDLAVARGFRQFFSYMIGAAGEDDLEYVMRDPHTVMTFSDSGAHVSQIVDACIQTHLLAHWARDRKTFSIEDAVRMVTLAPARAWGFHDRGLLRPGMVADVNVIDLPHLDPGMPEAVRDLPGRSQRLVMKASGIRATIVAGAVLLEDAEHTGALPGTLLRRRS